MSEYQYYAFQALDHPLTHDAQAEMRSLSSRVQLTASSASFVYNYGNFRGDPYQILAKYFDAMLYVSNWGISQVMFRFPKSAIPDEVMTTYSYAESLEWSAEGDYVIVNILLQEEEPSGNWIEGEGLLPGIAPLRYDILRGDYRALYLGWLMIAAGEAEVLEEDEDLTGPPIPPGLQALSPALENLVDFFAIDPDVVTAASQASSKLENPDKKFSAYLGLLSEAEKHNFLERLLTGELRLDIALENRLNELSGISKAHLAGSEQRTIRQLLAAATVVKQERREVERQQKEAVRLKKLETIAKQESNLWARIPVLIGQKQTSAYEEAVSILKDLRDLAAHQQREAEFKEKMAAIKERHSTLHGLQRRLKEAGLV